MLRRLPHLVIFLVAGSLYLTGLLAPMERALTDARFSLLPREATGDLVIVQIDARSLNELGVWPWPRKFHADLVERLFDAGVREVALDVDLSASSDPASDTAFTSMLEKYGRQVILPVFRQAAAPGTGSQELLDTVPLAAFRAHAQVGSVNMLVEADGLVRRAASSSVIEDTRYATMFTLLAGPAYLDLDSFSLDYGIDPWTIPRLSYIDVLRGTVSPEHLAGKRVLVGSGAAELGDNLPVPIYRNLPGPVVQALAYESLVQGRALRDSGVPVTALIGALLAIFLGARIDRMSWQKGALVTGATIICLEGAALAAQAVMPVNPVTAPWLLIVALGYARNIFRVVTVQDIQLFRQRVSIAYRRALMDRVVQDSFDGIVITDHQGNIEVFNKSAAELLNCGIKDAVGRTIQEVLPVTADLIRQMAENSGTANRDSSATHSGPHECEIVRSDGEHIVIEIVISQFLNRHIRNPRQRQTVDRQVYNFTFRNVTERRRALDAEREALEQAQAANRTKTEFLANMSHELRTPLNAILGFSDMIGNEVFGPIEQPQYKQYIGDIRNSGQHLLEIINDILDVSKVELGQIKLNEEPIDLNAMAATACRILSGWPDSSKRDFESRVTPDMPYLLGDSRLIKQILVNLLSNAIKYSEPGDRVSLRIFVDESGAPTIEVEDTGIGIDPATIPFLTQPFYQVDGSLSRTHEGTGLGLCLVSAFAELHGGRLNIESEPGVGTKVSICFPPSRCIAPTHAMAEETDQDRTRVFSGS